MVIYVEYVIIDNMTIDIIILLLSKYLLKLKTTKTRVFLSALLGTGVALISPLLPKTINIVLKLLLAIAMVLVAYKITSLKRLLVVLITFYLCTFLMIGSCLGICEIIGIEFIKSNGILYRYDFPIGFVLLICLVVFVCTKNIVKVVFKKHIDDKLEHQVVIYVAEKQISVVAFLDTGNKIEKDGQPVSIINYKIFSKIYPNISPLDILLKKQLAIKNAEYLQISSLGTNTKDILIFMVDAICINKRKICDAYLGLTFDNFEDGTNCDMIISNSILGDDYENNKT